MESSVSSQRSNIDRTQHDPVAFYTLAPCHNYLDWSVKWLMVTSPLNNERASIGLETHGREETVDESGLVSLVDISRKIGTTRDLVVAALEAVGVEAVCGRHYVEKDVLDLIAASSVPVSWVVRLKIESRAGVSELVMNEALQSKAVVFETFILNGVTYYNPACIEALRAFKAERSERVKRERGMRRYDTFALTFGANPTDDPTRPAIVPKEMGKIEAMKAKGYLSRVEAADFLGLKKRAFEVRCKLGVIKATDRLPGGMEFFSLVYLKDLLAKWNDTMTTEEVMRDSGASISTVRRAIYEGRLVDVSHDRYMRITKESYASWKASYRRYARRAVKGETCVSSAS